MNGIEWNVLHVRMNHDTFSFSVSTERTVLFFSRSSLCIFLHGTRSRSVINQVIFHHSGKKKLNEWMSAPYFTPPRTNQIVFSDKNSSSSITASTEYHFFCIIFFWYFICGTKYRCLRLHMRFIFSFAYVLSLISFIYIFISVRKYNACTPRVNVINTHTQK